MRAAPTEPSAAQSPHPLSSLEGAQCVAGPLFVWRAAITLARATAFPAAEDDEDKRAAAERNQLYQRVLTVIEAVLESLPQLLLQGTLFYLHPERIDPYVFAFSVGCSVFGLVFAVRATHIQSFTLTGGLL